MKSVLHLLATAGLLGAAVAAHGFPSRPITTATAADGVLRRGTTQRFSLAVTKGDFVRGSVDQLGVSVRVALISPGGAEVRGYQGLSRGKNKFSFVAAETGQYSLLLSTTEKRSGAYRLTIDKIVPAGTARPSKDGPESPRLLAFQEAFTAGKSTLDDFWNAVAREGTPLIEPVNDKDFRLTFLWRSADADEVEIAWVLPPHDDHALKRLPGTDIWYRSVTLPRGSRFTYRIAPDAPKGPGGVPAVAQADPLNPRRYQESSEADRYSLASLVELPGASQQPWTEVRTTKRGRIEISRFASKILGNDREVAIYTPHGYDPKGPAPALLVLFDEEAYLERIPTPTILDNLIAAGEIPPTAAVLVGNSAQENRNRELGGNPRLSDFVTAELLPWVRQHYRVTDDPGRTVIAGSSFGGLAAGLIAFQHPEIFGNVLAQSGSFWWSPTRNPFDPAKLDEHSEPGWLIRQAANGPKLPLRFYLDSGWFEGGEGGGILDTNRYFRDVLCARDYAVHYQEFVGGHEYINWRGTLADGLIALLGSHGKMKTCQTLKMSIAATAGSPAARAE